MKKTLTNHFFVFKKTIFRTALLISFIGLSESASAQCDSPMNIGVIPTETGDCSGVLVYAPERQDDCDGMITGTTSDPTSYNQIGTYTINWAFTDNDGNTYYGTQDVIIQDNDAPVPDEVTLPDLTGQCEVTVTSAPSSFDVCSGIVYGTTTDPMYYSTPGTYIINWKYTDDNGHSAYQSQNVIIADNTAPVPDDVYLPALSNECSITIGAIPTATDNCKGQISATTLDPLTYNTAGTYTITWDFDDSNGNTVSQTQSVVVTDASGPVADVSSLPDVTGDCSASVTSTPTATDNCTGQISATTSDPLTYNTPGTHTITWTYSDGINTTTQTQNVVINTIDITTSIAGTTITATQTGATYQWIDCNIGNSLIAGATNQNYTALTNGSYAVIVTTGSCSDTSACVNVTTTGILEQSNTMQFSIYPNPANGAFILHSGSEGVYSIVNELGQAIQSIKLNATNNYSMKVENLSNGIYFVIGFTNNKMSKQKIIVAK